MSQVRQHGPKRGAPASGKCEMPSSIALDETLHRHCCNSLACDTSALPIGFTRDAEEQHPLSNREVQWV